jgi:Na+/H+ antiporter NhaD/arsenite permease-like protein
MEHSGFVPALPWIAPFVTLLAGLAILPLAAPRFWHSNLHKLAASAACGLPVLVLYARNAPAGLLRAGGDYVSFIVLLGSLFVVSGGVLMDGDIEATPRANTVMLACGAVLASLIGTTGASMLLIRPLIHTNRQRRHTVHTFVFFIFVVSNVGGALTPLGDPPLFLGYLLGVPFTWPLRLFPIWLFTCLLLLALYVAFDTAAWRRETARALQAERTEIKPMRLVGTHNLALLGGIVAAAALFDEPWREIVMVLFAAVSWLSTSHHIRRGNQFTFHPILEVACVFGGIFVTMLPAMDLLRMHGASLGIREPWHFFWATGLLSSFLDNAPTYLAFFALGQGLHLSPDIAGMPHHILEAISAGAVFMGANTYLGNGPNFMVRAIAEARGIIMPSFGGYMLYSGAILLPTFLVVTLVFFR